VQAVVRRLRLRAGHQFPRHAHDGWSFGLVDDGSVRLWRAGAWYEAPRGAGTVLHPQEAHEGLVSPSGLLYTSVSVAVEAVAELLGRAGTPVFGGLLHAAGPIRGLVDAAGNGVAEERQERTAEALAGIFLATRQCRPAPAGRGVATAAKGLLDAGFVEPVSVRAIAARLGVATGSLIRAFRGHTGLTPYLYVVSRRVELARQLLAADCPPAEVAHRVGFYDQAHLTRHFTRLVGVTPAAYRRA
jgi:AraC-like DNA-binding protein